MAIPWELSKELQQMLIVIATGFGSESFLFSLHNASLSAFKRWLLTPLLLNVLTKENSPLSQKVQKFSYQHY